MKSESIKENKSDSTMKMVGRGGRQKSEIVVVS